MWGGFPADCRVLSRAAALSDSHAGQGGEDDIRYEKSVSADRNTFYVLLIQKVTAQAFSCDGGICSQNDYKTKNLLLRRG